MIANRALLVLLALATAVPAVHAQAPLRIGGFVDAYYAYDTGEPVSRLRAFTTQPYRHNTFSVNLAALRATYDDGRARGALAWGVGDYAEANYAAEPDYLRGLIEAYAGVQLSEALWLDAGVLPSHIGLESAYSAQNLTLGRSLMAEFSPYYEAGLRLTYTVSPAATVSALVLNGWQNIAETNDHKALGTQVTVTPTQGLLLNWSTFAGKEINGPGGTSTPRLFSDFYASWAVTPKVDLAAAFDVGRQRLAGTGEHGVWKGAAVLNRVRLSPRVAVNGRVEFYSDPREVLVVTPGGSGFEVASASLGLDVQAAPSGLFRIEARGFRATEDVFPEGDVGRRSRTGLLHASLALTF